LTENFFCVWRFIAHSPPTSSLREKL
jgi:hypothetical protein